MVCRNGKLKGKIALSAWYITIAIAARNRVNVSWSNFTVQVSVKKPMWSVKHLMR